MKRTVRGQKLKVGNGNQQLEEEGEMEEQLLKEVDDAEQQLSGGFPKPSEASVVKRRSTRVPTPRRLASGSVVSGFARPTSEERYTYPPTSPNRYASQPSGSQVSQRETGRMSSVTDNKRRRKDSKDSDDDKDKNELAVQIENQKKLIQQLQQQLEAERMEKSDLISQVERLKDEVQKQKSQPLRHGSGSEVGLHRRQEMRNRIARLTPESRRIKDRAPTPFRENTAIVVHDDSLDLDHDFIGNKDQERFLGMLEYGQVNEGKILRALIFDLQPATVLSAQPSGLPAYILLMMIRYADHINNDNRVRSLIKSATKSIKRLMEDRENSQTEMLDVTVLWLSNILRFMHMLNQYSGEDAFQEQNTQNQNKQCLQNLDLIEYYRVLSDHAHWIYMRLIKILKQGMQNMIVPAILKNTKMNSTEEEEQGEGPKPLDILISELDSVHNLLCSYGLDVEVIHQLFGQLFYYVCAQALNSLLQNKELCHLYTGLEIQDNVSVLEVWARKKKLWEAVNQPLRPITQTGVILILESSKSKSKSNSDVTAICDVCDDLTIQQVIKLLTLYSIKDGLDLDDEEEVEQKLFIQRVRRKLLDKRAKAATAKQQELLMNAEYTFPVKFPFNPSPVKLEDVNIPDSFGVNKWLKKI